MAGNYRSPAVTRSPAIRTLSTQKVKKNNFSRIHAKLKITNKSSLMPLNHTLIYSPPKHLFFARNSSAKSG